MAIPKVIRTYVDYSTDRSAWIDEVKVHQYKNFDVMVRIVRLVVKNFRDDIIVYTNTFYSEEQAVEQLERLGFNT